MIDTRSRYTKEEKAQMIGPLIERLEKRVKKIDDLLAPLLNEEDSLIERLDEMAQRVDSLSAEECEEYLQLSDKLEDVESNIDYLTEKRKRNKRKLRRAHRYRERMPIEYQLAALNIKDPAEEEKEESSLIGDVVKNFALMSIASHASDQTSVSSSSTKKSKKPIRKDKDASDQCYQCPVCKETFKINRHKKCGPVTLIKLQ